MITLGKLQLRFTGRLMSIRHTHTDGECEDRHFIDKGGFGELYQRGTGEMFVKYWIEREGECNRWEWMLTMDGQAEITDNRELVVYNEENDIEYIFRLMRWRAADDSEWAKARAMKRQDGLWPFWYEKIGEISEQVLEDELFHVLINEDESVLRYSSWQ